MARVSQLTLIFRDKLQNFDEKSNKISDVIRKNQANKPSNSHNDQLASWFASWSSFQIPLHYPNFTKEEYQVMPEEELDRLFKLYGLPTNLGDLSCKKQFAVGAFLWEKEPDSSLDNHESVDDNSSTADLGESSMMGLMAVMKRMVHYIFGV
ncbi:unnamed protein product [Arabis nemorensis]|uniref:DUF7722 domain-containing protein n=1 Tax=Arabis nemorensis TaxID=586526 RepID=A0A565CT79_9BRAS|nr:unnamed protein product [Arabis nemorensis]